MLDHKTTPRLHLGDLTPAATLDVNPINTMITIFRAADPEAALLPSRDASTYLQDAVGFTTLFYDTVSLRDARYPLCFAALVACLSGNSFGLTLFTTTGGGGPYPLPHLADQACLNSALLRAIRDFPRGWTEHNPDDDPFDQLENANGPIDLA